MNVNLPPHLLRAGETSRVDLLLIAEMVKPGARGVASRGGDGAPVRQFAQKIGRESRRKIL